MINRFEGTKQFISEAIRLGNNGTHSIMLDSHDDCTDLQSIETALRVAALIESGELEIDTSTIVPDEPSDVIAHNNLLEKLKKELAG